MSSLIRRPVVLLAGLVAVLAVVTVVWVSIDRRPPESDHANHLERALRCYRVLAEHAPHPLQSILAESSFYPPLVPCLAGLLYFVLPVAPLTAQAVMLAFLAVGVSAVFALGRRLLDAETGLLAAFFFATAPFVIFSLTNFQLDLPLAAMVALALYTLFRAEAFARPGWCVVLGVVLGLGMLTKPPFATYVLPAMLWSAWRAWRGAERGRRLARLGLALLIALALTLPWYGPRLVGLPMQIVNRSFKQAAEVGQAEALTPAGLLFYPRVFVPQFGVLAGPLCVWALWTVRRRRAIRSLLWLSTLLPFILYCLIQNKNLRYTLPILPAAALLTAVGVRGLRGGFQRGALVACLLAGALQISMTAFAVPPPLSLALFLTPLPVSFPPSPADWQEDRVLDDLARASGGRPATVAVVPNYNFFSVSNFRYEALRQGLPLQMTRGWTGPPLGIEFVILKTGSQGPSFTVEKAERLTRAFVEDRYLAEAFPVIAEYPLPDQSHGILRARRVPPLRDVPPAALARRIEQAHEAALADYVRDAVGLRISASYRDDAISRGEVDRLRVEAQAATVGELKRRDRAPLRVRDVRLDVERLLVNPRRLVDTGALEVLDAGALRIDALVITQADLDAFLRGQPAGSALSVQLLEGGAEVRLKRFPGSARVGVLPGGGDVPFALNVQDVRVANVPIPGALVDWVVRHFDPTPRLRALPTRVSLGSVRITPGRVEVVSPTN
ncbi:MAG TPA: LmeA family phospholipid-binding protein [Methylomirabilota bacterium]|nr:LmeA family phospholipid-binding protein [Methylomirabilota bacterium]